MDVEKLKKMNELSKELKKHGMAESTKEVFEQAGEMMKDEAMGDIISKSSSQEKSKEGFDHQYQIMLERQNRQIAQEVQALKETVAALKEAVEQLKQARPAQQQPKEERQATFAKKEEPKEHPRQGAFTSEDVAVDKVFYFGKK
ncbi:hypothetical protein KY310_00360 [Candidatus Woesearchaeota archaeon]|nr:hypothetical protein [Candidatus Woesearchaeota archaeon]